MSERPDLEYRRIDTVHTSHPPGHYALRRFLSEEALTSRDTRMIAAELAQYVRTRAAANGQTRYTVLAEILGEGDIVNSPLFRSLGYDVTYLKERPDIPPEVNVVYRDKQGDTHEAVLEISEISYWLNRIRKEIQEQLRLIDEEDIHVPTGRVSNKAQFLNTPHVDKRPIAGTADSYDTQLMTGALNKFFSLRERSPYLLYPKTVLDPETGRMLQQKMDFTTLDELLRQDPPPKLEHVLGWYAEAIRGLLFLQKHGLQLSDLDATNIAIRTDTGTAAWFDYDGMRQQGDMVLYYPTKIPYMPPDRILMKLDNGFPMTKEQPISERDMVFEMGVTLQRIRERYQSRLAEGYSHVLIDLERDMQKSTAERRGEAFHLEDALQDVIAEQREIERYPQLGMFKPVETRVYPPSTREESYAETVIAPRKGAV